MIRIKIDVRENNFNKAMAQYRKRWKESGIVEELKDRKYYKNGSTKRNEKKQSSKRRFK
jgi:ribosomal protein S21